MSDPVNLDEQRIIRDLRQGNFRVTTHAINRMYERKINQNDISACAKTMSSIQYLDGKYRVKGYDVMGDPLIVVCVWNGSTLIITLF